MFYAVYRGRTPGIYETWADCRDQIHGFPGSVFKKFVTHQTAVAYMETGPQWLREEKLRIKFSQ